MTPPISHNYVKITGLLRSAREELRLIYEIGSWSASWRAATSSAFCMSCSEEERGECLREIVEDTGVSVIQIQRVVCRVVEKIIFEIWRRVLV